MPSRVLRRTIRKFQVAEKNSAHPKNTRPLFMNSIVTFEQLNQQHIKPYLAFRCTGNPREWHNAIKSRQCVQDGKEPIRLINACKVWSACNVKYASHHPISPPTSEFITFFNSKMLECYTLMERYAGMPDESIECLQSIFKLQLSGLIVELFKYWMNYYSVGTTPIIHFLSKDQSVSKNIEFLISNVLDTYNKIT